MLDKRFIAIAAAAVTLIAVFVIVLKDKDVALMGNYKSYITDYYCDDDGMTCCVRIVSEQSLSPTGANVQAKVGMTFHFGGGIEFSDMTLRYDVKLRGGWSAANDFVTMSPDTASFSYACLGSSAVSNVEKVMAKQLMKFVDVSLVPKIRRRIIEANSRSLRVYSNSPGGIVAHASGKTIILFKH